MRIKFDIIDAHSLGLMSDVIGNKARRLDSLARKALLQEVSLENKPGLVCPSDNGGHDDMDYPLFITSIKSLHGYFHDICLLGYHKADFHSIRSCAIAAEHGMMTATGGINTHRGAIFNMGFICAAVGRCFANNIMPTSDNICRTISQVWQYDLLHNLPRQNNSHGQLVKQRYGLNGAIEEVAAGFPSIMQNALPALNAMLGQGFTTSQAHLQTLMVLLSVVNDTNIAWRGGIEALNQVKQMAGQFVAQDGVFNPNSDEYLRDICQFFIHHHLSAGGAADLLGATLLFKEIENEFCNYI